jgi:hypothetical protein
MAIAQTTLTPSSWIKIGDNVTSITFQCISQFPIVVGITTTDSAPATTAPGLVYNQYQGEVKKLVADLSYESSPTYVWAKATSSYATVNYETP